MGAPSKPARRARRAEKRQPLAPAMECEHEIHLVPELDGTPVARTEQPTIGRLAADARPTVIVDHSSALIDSEVVSAILDIVRWSADRDIVPRELAKPGRMRIEALDKLTHHAIARADERLASRSQDIVAVVHHATNDTARVPERSRAKRTGRSKR
jgi:hypothetical protein